MIEFDFSYRKLNVYQLSKILVTDIYKMVKRFPLTETYALSDQMRRAVVSISSNIAEGTSKASPKEQFHFLEIAYDLHFITQNDLLEIQEKVVSIYKMLSSMQSTIKTRIENISSVNRKP